MRVCLEATSLLARRSGVGHSTAALAEALVAADAELEVLLLPLSVRGSLGRNAPRHPRIVPLGTRVPARAVQAWWRRASWPPAEMFCGPVDIVHGPNYMLPPLLKARGVVTVHDLAFVRMPDMVSAHVRTYERSVPVSCSRAARIVVPSAFTAAELAEWLPSAAPRIRVVPMAVRDVFLRPGGRLTPPRAREMGLEERYVLFLGNLEARKNLDVLLEASERVRAQLVLAGQPSAGWDAIAAARARQLDRAVVTGYLPDAEVAALVRGAAVFVYPSRYEGFGIPPLEAMACGVPVVAAKTSALPDTLGGHARLVQPDDPDELAAAISSALDDPGDTTAARAYARSFTWDGTARATLDVYREALAA